MATTYPATKQTFTDPSGTSPLATGPDHAALHTTTNDTLEAIQDTLGTTSGTNIAKNFVAGNFPVRQNVGGTVLDTLVGGTHNNGTFGTPTLMGGTIVVNGTAIPINIGAALAPTVGTITDAPSGTLTANAQSAQLFETTFGTTAGNRTIGTPNNPTNGQALLYRIKQNAAATGTIVWASVFKFDSSTGTATAGTASTWSYYGFRYNLGDVKWDYQGGNRNII